jgi:hypothetical protein
MPSRSKDLFRRIARTTTFFFPAWSTFNSDRVFRVTLIPLFHRTFPAPEGPAKTASEKNPQSQPPATPRMRAGHINLKNFVRI